MKRLLTTVLSFAVALTFSAPSANATVLLQDDFESDTATLSGSAGDFDPVIGEGDIGGTWNVNEPTLDTLLQVVNDDPPWSGVAGNNNYLSLERTAGGSNTGTIRAEGWDPEIARNQIVKVSCSVYVPTGNQNAVAVSGWDDAGWEIPWWENRAFDVYFWPDGYVYYYDGVVWPPTDDQKLFPYTQDAWLDMTITANMSAGTFSLNVEGNTVDDLTWAGGVNTVQSIMFGPDADNSKYCVDNVVIEVLSGSLEGDLNDDGFVNSSDLDIVRGSWGETVTPGTSGDANADGVVNSGDLDIVRANWGRTASAAVPEPSLAILLLWGGIVTLGLYRRR